MEDKENGDEEEEEREEEEDDDEEEEEDEDDLHLSQILRSRQAVLRDSLHGRIPTPSSVEKRMSRKRGRPILSPPKSDEKEKALPLPPPLPPPEPVQARTQSQRFEEYNNVLHMNGAINGENDKIPEYVTSLSRKIIKTIQEFTYWDWIRWTIVLSIWLVAIMDPKLVLHGINWVIGGNYDGVRPGSIFIKKYNMNGLSPQQQQQEQQNHHHPEQQNNNIIPDSSLMIPPRVRIIEPSDTHVGLTEDGVLELRVLVENLFPERFTTHASPKVCLRLSGQKSGDVMIGCYETKTGYSDVTLRNMHSEETLHIHVSLISRVRKLAKSVHTFHVAKQDIISSSHPLVENKVKVKESNDEREVCTTKCTRTCTLEYST